MFFATLLIETLRVKMIKSVRNLEIDRLRGIAILMTMYIHYSRVFFPWNIHPIYVHGGSIANLFSYCWAGVDLFFVISGYVISKTLISQIDLYKSDVTQLALRTCSKSFQ